MDRINGADTFDIGNGRRGFRDENLVSGVAGTEVTADFLNALQEELMKVVTEAGLVPSATDWTQLWQALQIHGLSTVSRSRQWLAVTSMSVSSPPASPASGDTYLIPTGASGVWSANVGKIAQWAGSTWTYLTPPDGHGISLPNGRVFERINGAYVELLSSETRAGLVKLATIALASAGADTTTAVTPAGLAAAMSNYLLAAKVKWDVVGDTVPIRGADGGIQVSYVYNPTTKMTLTTDGNLYGSAWGGVALSDYLTRYALLANVSTNVVNSTILKRAGDGYAYATGFYNPSTKAQFGENGDIFGTAWGNVWLSAHLPATYAQLSTVSVPVVNDTILKRSGDGYAYATGLYNPGTKAQFGADGNAWGTIWGSDWLSNYLVRTYLAKASVDELASANTVAIRRGDGGINANLIYNPTTKMNLGVDGNIWGTMWGSGWLSDYLSNNYAKLSAMPASLAANGYQKLPSGLILQWGTSGNFTAEGGQTVNLPIAFPNACLAAMVSLNGYATNDVDQFAQLTNRTTTALSIYIQRSSGGTYTWPITASFFAIGY